MGAAEAIATQREALWKSGYRPVPVYNIDARVNSPGKQPKGFAWQREALLDPPGCVARPPDGDALNTGVMANGYRVVDLDVDDGAVSDQLMRLSLSLLGQAPMRFRENSGRRLLVYRAAHGEPGKRSIKGALGKVEVLGKGQQFVAYGKHPSGADLCWERPLEDWPAEDLQPVSEDQIGEFLARAAELIGSAEHARDVVPFRLGEYTANSPTGLGEIDHLLSFVPPDSPYEEWVSTLMAVHAATGGSSDGLEIADNWSRRGSKYKPGEVAKKWGSFRSTGITGATLAELARQHGADLSAIRIAHMPEDPEWKAMVEHGRQVARTIKAPRAGQIRHYVEDDDGNVFDEDGNAAPEEVAEVERQRRVAARSDLEWFDDVRPVVEVPYIVKGLLDHGSMSVVYGPSNSGKTFFALDLVFNIAIGNQWRDRRVHGGSVLYLAAEGGNGIANRIAGLRSVFGSVDVPLALRRAGLDLLKPTADLNYVITLAEEVARREPLAVIVIDTLSRVIAGGDENAASDMTAFIKNIDVIRQKTGAHIMIVHHTGKDAAKGARGHSSLRAATDTEIELSVDDFENRVAKVTKQRDYEGGEEFVFGLKSVFLGIDQDGDNVTTCVIEPIEKVTTGGEDAPPIEVCRAMLKEIDAGWTSNNPLSTAPQSKHSGRYAARYLATTFKLPQGKVQKLLEGWIDGEIIVVDMVDFHSKKRGLRVREWI
ncbi:Bifunctional DNA primase/polymerase, N-terminal [Fulvimarina manganoxydans]|uniref:Bifunctional DNA primase/polymerase, N-terminal n=1 Tax=Fulvimarina manganoxydans TaxID=937218 RepID=A0A1W1Z2X0_9HYPH|nr:AAA family ATPase [Fulvimarina manganoxydans]SMC42795.1 Bifunctional DNA primase/polymerase, N-terminal [Fulvimarina manganoxydans]